MQDWELMMQDFIPDDMLAFELKRGEIEILEEGIHHPTTVRGAYFVSMMTKEKINFIVMIEILKIGQRSLRKYTYQQGCKKRSCIFCKYNRTRRL